MMTYNVSWRDFKIRIEDHILQKRGFRICRGQTDATWKLTTSFHRQKTRPAAEAYFQVMPRLADMVSTALGKPIEASTPEQQASLLALLQHHGFPTPILDWTFSPYIAAYFAFSDIDDAAPQSDKCAVYVFDYLTWAARFRQQYDVRDTSAHVSVLAPSALGNVRQFAQQGWIYTFTNVVDVEEHICLLESAHKTTFLEKYQFSVKEKPYVIKDLEVMGIQAYSLFGGADGLCRYLRESVFQAEKMGSTPTERFKELMDTFKLPEGSASQVP